MRNSSMQDPHQLHLVAVQKDTQGNITAFRTNQGDVLQYTEALALAKQGRIARVEVCNENGKETLHAQADGTEGNDLNFLPEFNQIL